MSENSPIITSLKQINNNISIKDISETEKTSYKTELKISASKNKDFIPNNNSNNNNSINNSNIIIDNINDNSNIINNINNFSIDNNNSIPSFEKSNIKYHYYIKDGKIIKEKIIPTKPSLNKFKSTSKIREYIEKSRNILFDDDEENNKYEQMLYQEKHLCVTPDKWNDEKYKLLAIQKIKRKSAKEFKSAKKFKDFEEDNHSYKKMLTDKKYLALKKKKIIYSCKKDGVFYVEFNVKNNKEGKIFPLYRDSEIGIFEYFQISLTEAKVDEDNDTDEEQIQNAEKYCKKQVWDGVGKLNVKGVDYITNSRYLGVDMKIALEEYIENEKEKEEQNKKKNYGNSTHKTVGSIMKMKNDENNVNL